MDQKMVNLALLAVVILLGVNLIYPLELTGNVIDLQCQINGNVVDNINLCCHEMQRFSNCEDNVCEDENYLIEYTNDVLDYCEDKGYDIGR